MMRIVLLLFLFFNISGCQFKEQNITQNIKVSDKYSWDFGQVKEGKILRHNFLLKNESKQILNIKEVNTSCGCTVSEAKKKSLLSGETTLIEVKFDTKGYSGPTQQHIYVHTDNLDNPIIKFIIKADVVK